MPKRGSGSKRFKNLTSTQNADETWRTGRWEVRHGPLELSITCSDGASPTPQHLDLSAWLPAGSFAVEFADAFGRAYANSRRTSRRTAASNLTYGWVKYLTLRGRVGSIEDITTEMVDGFLKALQSPDGIGGTKLKVQTQIHYFGTLKKVLAELLARINGGNDVLKLPVKPFAGKKILPADAKDLSDEVFVKLMSACATEALELLNDVGPRLSPLLLAIESLEVGNTFALDTIEKVAATLLLSNGGVCPERKTLKDSDPETFAATERFGYTNVRRLCHPQINDLLPLAYLLAAYTAFNQQALLMLQLSGISRPSFFSSRKIVLTVLKLRSNSIQRRSFGISDELLSVDSIIRFVENWTSVLRRYAPDYIKDDLWLFASKWKSNGNAIRSLASRDKGQINPFGRSITTFAKRHKLPFIGLKSLRTTFGSIFQRQNPGDLEGLRILLGQKSVNTTADSYRTREAREAGEELLSGNMAQQQRWVQSGGRVDARDSSRGSNKSAATPGFGCLDLFDSPMPLQQRGRPCTAYGMCPACPLAYVPPESPYALARLTQLKEKFLEARASLGEQVWATRFLGAYEFLTNKWIPELFTASTSELARKLHLSPLPRLE